MSRASGPTAAYHRSDASRWIEMWRVCSSHWTGSQTVSRKKGHTWGCAYACRVPCCCRCGSLSWVLWWWWWSCWWCQVVDVVEVDFGGIWDIIGGVERRRYIERWTLNWSVPWCLFQTQNHLSLFVITTSAALIRMLAPSGVLFIISTTTGAPSLGRGYYCYYYFNDDAHQLWPNAVAASPPI